MKTKYRAVSNGHWELLQYEAEVTNLFKRLFGCTKEWRYVPRAYYHKTYGRGLDSTGFDTRVNSLKNDLEWFVQAYPDITEYFKVFEAEQALLEAEVAAERAETEARKSNIRYFE